MYELERLLGKIRRQRSRRAHVGFGCQDLRRVFEDGPDRVLGDEAGFEFFRIPEFGDPDEALEYDPGAR